MAELLRRALRGARQVLPQARAAAAANRLARLRCVPCPRLAAHEHERLERGGWQVALSGVTDVNSEAGHSKHLSGVVELAVDDALFDTALLEASELFASPSVATAASDGGAGDRDLLMDQR